MKLIVTGAYGFIANQIINKLSTNFVIYGIVKFVNNDRGILNSNVIYCTANDFLNKHDLYSEKFAILHLANSMPLNNQSSADYFIKNSIEWINFFEKIKLSFFCTEIINFESYWQYDEYGKVRNVGDYILSKNIITMYLDANKKYFERVFSIVLYDVYSEFDTRQKLLNTLNRYQNKTLKLKNGDKEKIFVHVRYVIECVQKYLIEKINIPDRIYLAHDNPRTLFFILKTLNDNYNLKINLTSGYSIDAVDPYKIYIPKKNLLFNYFTIEDTLVDDFKNFT